MDRKPHPGWLDRDERCRELRLPFGRSKHHLIATVSGYWVVEDAAGVVDLGQLSWEAGPRTLEAAQLAAENALRALLAAALDELGSGA